MTTCTRPGRARPVLLLAGTAAAAAGLAALSVATASGVTHLGGDSYHTEFAQPGWWAAGWIMVVPVYLLARRRPTLAPAGVLASAVPPFVVALVGSQRAHESGWAQGFEILGYLYAGAMALGFVTAALVGWMRSS